MRNIEHCTPTLASGLLISDDATEVVKIGETDDDSITISRLLKNNTIVKIENATTRPLIEVKYGVKDFTLAKSSSGENNYYLPINKYVEQNFTNGDIHEYVVFILSSKFSENYKGVKVRTAEKIFVEKESAKEIRITDKTMVVLENKYFFKLYAKNSNTGVSYKVHTHELFELTADVPKSITIDDNTRVVVEGTTEPVTIASLLMF